MPYNPEKPYKNPILKLIKETWDTPYISVREGIYPVFKKKFNYPEIDHTDGIGTKGIYHWNNRTFREAVLDALAMNLNDLAMARAVPYKLQCHLVVPEDDNKAILEIMKNLVAECKKRKIVITGGETSIQNNIQSLDISLTVSGFVKRYEENRFQLGDVLIGFASNGLHSNGFTMVRKKLGNKFFKALIEPTKIYMEMLQNIQKKYTIHGMMHITGGAYTKLKSLLSNADAVITDTHSLKPQAIFHKLYARKISDRDMYRTFNCGIGFVLSTPKDDGPKIVSEVKGADIIGETVPGRGKVRITSFFSGKEIKL